MDEWYRILFSNIKEETIDVHNNLDELPGNYAEKKKSQSQKA
jgi:hypothetical protein